MLRAPPDPQILAQAREVVHVVDPVTVLDWYRDQSALIVDVREPYEYARAHIPGAVLHPLSAFECSRIPEPGPRRLVLHCAVGVRCGHASLALIAAGWRDSLYRIEGGIAGWMQVGGPVESGSWR